MTNKIWAKPGLCSQCGDGGGGTPTTLPPGSSGDHRALSFRDAPDQHPILSIVGLQGYLDTKAAIGHQHAITDILGLVEAMLGKAPTVHAHMEADILDLDKYTQAQVDAMMTLKSNKGHTHDATDIPDLGDTYAPLIHTHEADEIDYDNTDSGLVAVDVQAAIDELANITDPGEVIQAVITYGAGDGLPAGDLNGTDFTGHPDAVDTYLPIFTGDLYIFYHRSAAYLWSGPRGVSVGLGGNYIAVPADLIALSSNDHAGLINRDIADQHPIMAITDLQDILDGKADIVHTHLAADITDLQPLLDAKADVVHDHVEADIIDLDKYSRGEIDIAMGNKLNVDHVTQIPSLHIPIGGLVGQVVIKTGTGDHDVGWACLSQILECGPPPPTTLAPTTTPAPTTSV